MWNTHPTDDKVERSRLGTDAQHTRDFQDRVEGLCPTVEEPFGGCRADDHTSPGRTRIQ